VLPVSSQIERIFLCETLITINGKSSKVMADQLTTVSELRFFNKIGAVNDEEMSRIESTIKLQLGLE
jgi:mRNA interferase MazF